MNKLLNNLKLALSFVLAFFSPNSKKSVLYRNRIQVKGKMNWYVLNLKTGDVQPVEYTEKDGRKFFDKQENCVYLKAYNFNSAINKFLKLSRK